eukprot:TRINITY_DN9636_c0_g1_i3.p1 TRINITY_DN9636_c0_g1~~TRINITY_DN9636_c0_g1_i3.p1  ORF type:complete len:147 (+),score=5.82 TRINITY_DN9636_c0_g1_i3:484-924(+)
MLPSSPRGKIQRHLTLHVAGNPTLTSSPRDLHPDIYLPIHVAGIPTLPTPLSTLMANRGHHRLHLALVTALPSSPRVNMSLPSQSTWQLGATLPSPPHGNPLLPSSPHGWPPDATFLSTWQPDAALLPPSGKPRSRYLIPSTWLEF